jgi:hypothetical protein
MCLLFLTKWYGEDLTVVLSDDNPVGYLKTLVNLFPSFRWMVFGLNAEAIGFDGNVFAFKAVFTDVMSRTWTGAHAAIINFSACDEFAGDDELALVLARVQNVTTASGLPSLVRIIPPCGYDSFDVLCGIAWLSPWASSIDTACYVETARNESRFRRIDADRYFGRMTWHNVLQRRCPFSIGSWDAAYESLVVVALQSAASNGSYRASVMDTILSDFDGVNGAQTRFGSLVRPGHPAS